jgi:hypothetical protein
VILEDFDHRRNGSIYITSFKAIILSVAGFPPPASQNRARWGPR